jgi:uncharacterized damage-inducible protein DinB
MKDLDVETRHCPFSLVVQQRSLQNMSTPSYLDEARRCFREYKRLAEGTFVQLRPEEWLRTIDSEANSVGAIVKHMAGNMRSRWTDFLTSDGEKPDRNRDQEFVLDSSTTPEQIRGWWEAGWQCVFQAVEPLREEDLARMVHIRGHEHTVLQAVNRQITHYAYHVGQIVLLAKHFRGAEWKSLTIPKGQSAMAGVQAEAARRARGEK